MTSLKSTIDYLPHKQSSRYSVELELELFLRETHTEVWRRIVDEAAKKLATAFIEFHGGEVLNAVKSEDVSKRVVEEIVRRMIDNIKEK